MRILYFTTSMMADDFAGYAKHWKISLNPSNQNFHNKIIRSLAITEKVEVFSCRPYSYKSCLIKKLNAHIKEDKNITWNYLSVTKRKFFRIRSYKLQINKLLKGTDLNDTVILTDTINPTVISSAEIATISVHSETSH